MRNRVKRQMEKTQREYYLEQQMKAIQKELGDGDEGRGELEELEEQLAALKMPQAAREKQMPAAQAEEYGPDEREATVVRNYLDWILAVPWQKSSRLKKDIKVARDILDADHYGLEKVKDRIIEFLAVQQRTIGQRPVLYWSARQASARRRSANLLPAHRSMSAWRLAGCDEAEIRGHRRTYIRSMPAGCTGHEKGRDE